MDTSKNFGIKLSLFLIYFVFAALLNSVGILISQSIDVYGVSKPDAAILEPFKDLSIAFMAFLVGSFLPRLGFKKGMLISLAVVFFGCLGMYFGNSFWAVKMLFLCTGLSFAVVKVSVFALIGHITDSKKDHSSLMNLVETVFMLGIIFMYVVFPLFERPGDKDAWLNGYILMAALILVAFLIILFTKFDIGTTPSQGLSKEFKEMMGLFAWPVLWVFVPFAFFYVMTEQGIMTWLPTFNKEILNIESTLAKQVSVLLMLSIALGRFLAGLLVKKIQWVYIALAGAVLAIVLVLMVLPMAANVQPTTITSIVDLPAVSFLFPMIGLFLAPLYPLVNSAVLTSMPKERHSSLAGLLTFFSAIGGTVGSLVVGHMFDTIGGDKVFYLSLVPLGIMLVLFFFLNRFTKA